jgi:hypothetical protein
LILTGCAPTQSITGSFTLISSGIFAAGTPECSGEGGYSDIRPGLQVTVKNGSGSIIGKSSLGPNEYSGENANVVCKYSFKINNVPKADFYQIEVGSRGALSYSFEELRKQDWNVAFSLGN